MNSLRVRVPVLAMAILTISLVLSTSLAYLTLAAVGDRDLQAVLDRERARFATSIVELLKETPADQPLPLRLEESARRYLALNPSNEQYVSIVRIEGRPGALASESGPVALRPLLAAGRIPRSEPGMTRTVETDQGPLRSLMAPIVIDGRPVGLYQIVAPLQPISDATFEALRGILYLEGTILLVGGAVLAVVLFRALRPLSQLAVAARSIELDRLGQRVPVPERQDEVGQLARDFNEMLSRLERAAEDRQRFLAAISHELRTPITISRGHVETLQQVSMDETAVAETASVLREELQRIGRLVEDLMALARSEAPGFVARRPLSVRRFFDDLRLRLTGLDIADIRLDDPADVWVEADANRLGQALLNLIVNSHVHTPEGTKITVGARAEGPVVVLFVRDDGPGIEPALRTKVFEPFVRGDAPRGGHESTGLGLAVVRAITEAHQGRVSLRTGADGTEIAIRLATCPPQRTAAGDGRAERSEERAVGT